MSTHPRPWHLLSAALFVSVACGSNDRSSGFGANAGGPGGSGGSPGSSGGGDNGGGSLQDDGGAFGNLIGPGSDAGQVVASEGGAPSQMPLSVDHCTTGAAAGLSGSSLQKLLAGGSPGSLRLLYPYAQTVFPRGLIAPSLMWDGAGDGGAVDYVYVHIKSNLFEYKGCLAPTAAGQLDLPQDVWTAMGTRALGASDPFSVSLTVIASGVVTGPVTEPIIMAPATLKGSIYYNSYTSQLVASMNIGSGGGAVLRITPGQSAQVFLGQNGCTGCHAVSANGTRMVADPFTPNGSGSTYALTTQGSPNPSPLVANAPNATFVGVYPDGSLYVGNAHPNNGAGGPRAGGPGALGPVDAALYETDTGNVVNNSGIPTGAMMPMFSPDGKHLTFTDYAISNGHGLATMAFDLPSRTASGYKQVFQVSDMSTYPGWPFFLPDNGGIVFAIGTDADYSGGGVGLGVGSILGSTGAPTSDLYMLDVATGSSKMLAQAMGFASDQDIASDKTYLPFGASEELHHNYDPTVSPIAAGGYFWIFFDSYRHYGNQGLQRQLWGTAIDVSASAAYTSDPSHPAFYMTGQELGTGNHRAFTALEPCHKDGNTCTTGVDCCGGFCTNGMCGAPPTSRCSNTDEACGAGHCPSNLTCMCCNPQDHCINGFCAQLAQ